MAHRIATRENSRLGSIEITIEDMLSEISLDKNGRPPRAVYRFKNEANEHTGYISIISYSKMPEMWKRVAQDLENKSINLVATVRNLPVPKTADDCNIVTVMSVSEHGSKYTYADQSDRQSYRQSSATFEKVFRLRGFQKDTSLLFGIHDCMHGGKRNERGVL